MKAQLVSNVYGLTKGRIYLVLGIEADSLRLQDDEGLPYLYEPEDFIIVDNSYPDFWICTKGDEGEEYCYPKEWFNPGFFEDYFDGVAEAKNTFQQVLESRYGI